MQKVFNVYNDPGHGWGRVPRALLAELGIEDEISSYSYQRGQYVYLEEDCDLSKFMIAFYGRHGMRPQFKDSHTNRDSKIRSYDRYRPMVAA